ncbi:M55 family metallopeptidase [Fodinicola feengrottensis]|uniref:M55 family metallopeptidase n=1 Tax=Fodinicola feengrottensis TaxID=435914 RepID=UPI002441D6C5|nr:M55 family metallopeptidase [Fodinicola feengrottensis]
MTEDVNAAVSGALEGGATEVLVNDAHGPMRSLLPPIDCDCTRSRSWYAARRNR